MRPLTAFVLGFFMAIGVAGGCASSPIFPWPYYNAKISDREIQQTDVGESLSEVCYSEGTLLGKSGKEGWPDLPFTDCQPDPIVPRPGPVPNLMKCATVKIDDFYAVKSDDEKCHNDLDACQHGVPPKP